MPYRSIAQSNYIHMLAARGVPWAVKFVSDSHGEKVPPVKHALKKRMRNG